MLEVKFESYVNEVIEEKANCRNSGTLLCEGLYIHSQRNSVKANSLTQMSKVVMTKRMKISQRGSDAGEKINTRVTLRYFTFAAQRIKRLTLIHN